MYKEQEGVKGHGTQSAPKSGSQLGWSENCLPTPGNLWVSLVGGLVLRRVVDKVDKEML